ncbi:MAG TPA: hypothetical protein VNN80_24255 [Polyangiaceae bacterium]|nr:hypothetical protein [Polyangiaceae bacterium]
MTDLSLLRRPALARALHAGLPTLLVASALPACTEFADGDDLAPQNAELSSSPSFGGQATQAPEWACLNDPPAPPPAALGTTTVTFTMFVADTVTREPPPGLVVSACSPLDIECASPMVDDIRPEADGFIRAQVPRNFAGFFLVTSDQTVPAVLYVDGAVEEDITAAPMLLIGQAPFQALTQSQGVSIDPQMGHLHLRAFDCSSTLAAGIRFTNDRGGQPFAFVDALPVVGQTVTDAQGTAGFINVLPGLAVVTSVRANDGVVTKTASGQVRSGWFTYLMLRAGR